MYRIEGIEYDKGRLSYKDLDCERSKRGRQIVMFMNMGTYGEGVEKEKGGLWYKDIDCKEVEVEEEVMLFMNKGTYEKRERKSR